jgi:hypothetical protein
MVKPCRRGCPASFCILTILFDFVRLACFASALRDREDLKPGLFSVDLDSNCYRVLLSSAEATLP